MQSFRFGPLLSQRDVRWYLCKLLDMLMKYHFVLTTNLVLTINKLRKRIEIFTKKMKNNNNKYKAKYIAKKSKNLRSKQLWQNEKSNMANSFSFIIPISLIFHIIFPKALVCLFSSETNLNFSIFIIFIIIIW